MVTPEIGGNVNFKIKSQFMRELRENTFSGNKNEDAHDHVDRVLNIGTSSRNTSSSSDTDRLVAVISKLDNLGFDMKKLKENVYAIQVRCQICEGPHLDKECPLNEEVKQVDEVKYGRLDFNNALTDLEASISIMPFSMFKRLGIGKLEPINMVIEMADDTKCIPKGIVKNLLIKIDKIILPIDFIVLDIIEDFRIPVVLGRPLLATAHAKVDIF
ncbi:zinc knuckle CX2CX4HX4C containing protein [Tanacetum coccineum]|uniref:Zinc knuckle CX2CX4HX4C containing protein n=1 Tax=Tanacetum coccineum TaxID=301880 RepID=A0ABQ5H7B9_9ASTR